MPRIGSGISSSTQCEFKEMRQETGARDDGARIEPVVDPVLVVYESIPSPSRSFVGKLVAVIAIGIGLFRIVCVVTVVGEVVNLIEIVIGCDLDGLIEIEKRIACAEPRDRRRRRRIT